jgi:hypothetical protein
MLPLYRSSLLIYAIGVPPALMRHPESARTGRGAFFHRSLAPPLRIIRTLTSDFRPIGAKGGFRMPFSFSDDEMETLTTLASGLPPAVRDGFVQLVAAKLSDYPPQALGPGLLYRLAVEVRRNFLKGGVVAVGRGGKYGRMR